MDDVEEMGYYSLFQKYQAGVEAWTMWRRWGTTRCFRSTKLVLKLLVISTGDEFTTVSEVPSWC